MRQNTKIETHIKELYRLLDILTYICKENEEDKNYDYIDCSYISQRVSDIQQPDDYEVGETH